MTLGIVGLAAALSLGFAQEAPEPEDEVLPEVPAEEEEDASPLDVFDEPPIEEETLPTVEDLAFPELEGDFDGDGAPDLARARESESGVQIAIDLSTTGETFVEPLGASSLASVEWRVVGPEELLTICDNPIDCPTTDGVSGARDVILVTIGGSDSFILHWNGDALETFFVDL